MKIIKAHTSHRAKAEEARSRPGMWVRVNTYGTNTGAHNVARRIALGLYEGIQYEPVGAFETKTEMAEMGTTVYVRYKGEK